MLQGYDWFVEQFLFATGMDLQDYKRPQMERRLTALRNRRGYETFEDYFGDCLKKTDLMTELLDRMTINVSEFFRNQPRWDVLTKSVVPILYRPGVTFSAWSAACSTGQEPYTLAILLASQIPIRHLSILATDIDETALRTARLGMYKTQDAIVIPEPFRERYLQPVSEGTVQFVAELRNQIQFSLHNLLHDSYGKEFDLIVCRNVLIYFTDEAKYKVYRQFAQSLRKGGILFVGSTEQIFRPEQYGLKQFQPFFYQRTE